MKQNDIVFLWAVKSVVWGSVCVADNQWFFEKNGITVKIIRFNDGKEVLDALVHNRIELAFAGWIPYLANEKQYLDVVPIATVAEGNDTQIILRNSVEELFKSKKIQRLWTISHTASEKARDQFLHNNTLSLKKISFVEYDPYQMVSALGRWDIDWFAIREPFVSYAQSLLWERITILNSKADIYKWYMNVFCKKKFLKKNKLLMEKILNCFVQANIFIQKNPQKSQKIIAHYSHIPLNILTKNWNRYVFYENLEKIVANISYMVKSV